MTTTADYNTYCAGYRPGPWQTTVTAAGIQREADRLQHLLTDALHRMGTHYTRPQPAEETGCSNTD